MPTIHGACRNAGAPTDNPYHWAVLEIPRLPSRGTTVGLTRRGQWPENIALDNLPLDVLFLVVDHLDFFDIGKLIQASTVMWDFVQRYQEKLKGPRSRTRIGLFVQFFNDHLEPYVAPPPLPERRIPRSSSAWKHTSVD